jgi:hypothetical protein|tara:strand:- start:2989 stop:3180 length:192 start_codon:yes stop_codon:yes gene_type:complete
MYYSRNECYKDIYLSLSLGLLSEEDIKDLIKYYEELEHYECCEGITSAYKDHKYGIKRENINN